jgi:addiction module RelE/StbE family toxin
MAYKLIWSPAARDDLHDIVRYISRDSPERAQAFGYRLIQHVEILQEHPELGRRVPEHHNPHIRELAFRPYRIVYRIRADQRVIDLVRVWHAARGTPELA